MGLNNLKCTDYVNVVVQALAHIAPLRSYLAAKYTHASCTSTLVHKLGELTRKLWSARNFKSTVRVGLSVCIAVCRCPCVRADSSLSRRTCVSN
jgi:hypothetical protein